MVLFMFTCSVMSPLCVFSALNILIIYMYFMQFDFNFQVIFLIRKPIAFVDFISFYVKSTVSLARVE